MFMWLNAIIFNYVDITLFFVENLFWKGIYFFSGTYYLFQILNGLFYAFTRL